MSPELFELCNKVTKDTKIPVCIWLKETDDLMIRKPKPDEILKMSKDEIKNFKNLARSFYREKIKMLQKPVIDELTLKNISVYSNTEDSPSIFAMLTPAEITTISKRDDIEKIYIDHVNKPELDTAAPTVGADVVWNRGITGQGVIIGEIDSQKISGVNPYLPNVTNNPNTSCGPGDSPCTSVDYGHATAVAGVIGSIHNSYKGIAHGITDILGGRACSWEDSKLQNATRWAIDNGAEIINVSWGWDTNRRLESRDRYYDNRVVNDFVTVVKSAGNNAHSCGTTTGNVTSPGLAYNVITVGDINDNNTGSRGDDTMYKCSSYRDPVSTHGDREKPEVVAPAEWIITTLTYSPWIGECYFAGTSYAAPVVSAAAALLMERNPALVWWSEPVKAILMATATYNIEGDARLSDKDGAGSVLLGKADNVAANNQWCSDMITPSDFGPNGYLTTMSDSCKFFSANAGQRIRVAIAWDAFPSYSLYDDQPGTDLDLKIDGPNGNLVASSESYDNTFELVDFIAPITGTYKIRIYKDRFADSYTYLGWAWHKE